MTAARLRVLLVAVGFRPDMLASTAWLEFTQSIGRFAEVEQASVAFHDDLGFRLRRRTSQLRRLVGRPATVEPAPASDDGGGGNGEGHDLALLLCPGPFDLFALDQVRSLVAGCRQVAAWPIETWPTQGRRSLSLEPVDWFDRIFVASHAGATLLDDAWGSRTPVEYLPLAVDSLRFSEAARPERPILAFNPGRRSPVQHAALKRAAAATGRLYLFDTLASPATTDPVEHREAFAALAGNSDLMVCNYAKFDRPDEIGPAREVPGRLFEALAAGATPLGASPDGAVLTDTGLPADLVAPFDLEADTPVEAIIARASAGRERSEERIVLARLEHDWVHRWMRICNSLGLDPGDEARAHARRLAARPV